MCQLFLRACSPCCGVVVASKEKALEEVSFYRVVVGVVQNVADGGCFESIKKKLSVVWPFFGPKKDDDQNFLSFLRFVCVLEFCGRTRAAKEHQKRLCRIHYYYFFIVVSL